MTATFARLASANDLLVVDGLSPDGLEEKYLYSPDMVFRYAFGRWWGDVDLATTAVWVLLNPATGDTERRHRPTLERCVSRSRAAGFTGLVIVNIFAYRDTNPRNLNSAADAVGPANDEVLRVVTAAGAQTIAAWGAHGRLHGRSAQVGALLDSPLCLGTTQRGEPRHPLYVAADATLVAWAPVEPGEKAEPTDSDLRATLLRSTPPARAELRSAVEEMRSMIEEGHPTVDWSPRTGSGTSGDPFTLSHPEYSTEVTRLIAALGAVNAMAVFRWMDWGGSQRFPGGAGLEDATVADAMRLITAVVRGERFCDGTIEQAVEDGSLIAAAERILAEFESHPG